MQFHFEKGDQMKPILKIIKTILSLAFIVTLIVLVWALFTAMVKSFGEFTSSIEPTIVVAILSGLFAIIVNAVSKTIERKGTEFAAQKSKMCEIYEAFLHELYNIQNESKVSELLKEYHHKFAVNSSDLVYDAFIAMSDDFEKSKKLNSDMLIKEIRKELRVSKSINN